MSRNEQDSPRGLGNLQLISTPQDGNCQFSAIARALRNSGVNVLYPSNSSITMQSLRMFMAERITPTDISNLLDTYGTMETCAWLHKIEFEKWSAEEIIAYVKQAVSSSKPVIYQGDDWSLGILSRELNVSFIVLRDDGSVQGGLPKIEEGSHIIILYFYDLNPNERPSGVTNGHYDLISVKDEHFVDGKTLFTLGTLPLGVLLKLKEYNATREKKLIKKPIEEQSLKTLHIEPQKVLQPSPCLFPIQCSSDPTTSDQWFVLVEASILTMPDRMEYYSRLEHMKEFEQLYTLVFVRSDAALRIILSKTDIGLYIFTLILQFDDPIDGPGEALTFKGDNSTDAYCWFVSQVGKDDALAKARVRTSISNAEVSIHLIDKALLVPQET